MRWADATPILFLLHGYMNLFPSAPVFLLRGDDAAITVRVAEKDITFDVALSGKNSFSVLQFIKGCFARSFADRHISTSHGCSKSSESVALRAGSATRHLLIKSLARAEASVRPWTFRCELQNATLSLFLRA